MHFYLSCNSSNNKFFKIQRNLYTFFKLICFICIRSYLNVLKIKKSKSSHSTGNSPYVNKAHFERLKKRSYSASVFLTDCIKTEFVVSYLKHKFQIKSNLKINVQRIGILPQLQKQTRSNVRCNKSFPQTSKKSPSEEF